MADAGYPSLLDLLDPPAAFDTVYHSILLDRLCDLALGWFQSYLPGRTECVSFDGAKSLTQPVTWSVPQDFVLGPLLFTLYLLPLTCVINIHCVSFRCYADDTQLYIKTDTPYSRFTPLSPQGLITVILSSFGSQARIFKSSKTFKTSTARILRVRKYDHITPILNTLHCLLMEHRIVYKVSLLANHGMYGNAYLKELLMNQTSSRTFCSSTANLLNTRIGILVLSLECPGPVHLTPLPRVPTDRSNDPSPGSQF